jgi:hypothetical protein
MTSVCSSPLAPTGTAQDRHLDFGRPAFQQHATAFTHCSAGGQYVIDQQHPLSMQFATKGKSTFQITTPGLGGQALLRRSSANALQQAGTDRPAQPSSEHLGQQQSLVVAALAQADGMQRHRHEQIWGQLLWQDLQKLESKGLVELELAIVFEAMDQLPQTFVEQTTGMDNGEGGRVAKTSFAKVILPPLGGIGQGATRAKGVGNRLDAKQTGGAEKGDGMLGQQRAATGAGGGKKKIEHSQKFGTQHGGHGQVSKERQKAAEQRRHPVLAL